MVRGGKGEEKLKGKAGKGRGRRGREGRILHNTKSGRDAQA